MRAASFRLRIALGATLLSGLALAGFAGAAWWQIREARIARLDGELAATLARIRPHPRESTEWRALEGTLRQGLGLAPDALLLAVSGGRGERLHRSPGWPAALDPDSLDWPRGGKPGGQIPGLIASGGAATGEIPNGGTAGARPLGGPGSAPLDALGQVPAAREGRFQPGPGPGQGSGQAPGTGPQGGWQGDPAGRPWDPAPQGGLHGPGSRGSGARPGGWEGRPGGWGGRLDGGRADGGGGGGGGGGSPGDGGGDGPRWGRPFGRPPGQGEGAAPLSRHQSLPVAGQIWRFILLQYPAGRVAAGVPLRIVDLDLVPVRNAFLFAIPFALAFIAGGAWILSTRALRPVRELIRQIQGITAEGLDHRLDEEGTDSEFAALTVVFNAMLERLERGFHQASRFAADAAHELKTPLAILQGQIERAIAQAGAGSEQQAALTGMLDEVRRLSGLSRKLVLLAQADAGRLRIRPEPVDLSAFLADLAEDARLLAPGMAVSERIPPGLYVEADPDLLRQILHNLISNAVKYNLREQGWIELVAGQNGSDGDGDGGSGGHGGASGHGGAGYIEVAVINAAAPMDPVARGHLFDRFYRGDRSRSRNIEGTGLGLTLAREIARAHGGDLVIADSPPGSVRMVLRLPAPAGAAPAPGPGSATPAARASAPASR